jgi:ATP-dependent Clp protease ATP-binding subunit ClpA
VSAAVIGAGLVVTGCSPIKMGAAAIAGSQRITIATLDTEVTDLSQAAKLYPTVVQLNAAQLTQDTLTWLVRYQINEEVARQAGITISNAQAQAALAQVYQQAQSEAQSEGLTNVTLQEILAASGIPPNTYAELGRFEAIELQFVKNANGGTTPTSNSASTAAEAKFSHAQCLAAKALNIAINPQFGRMNYTQYEVVPAPNPVSRAQGPASAAAASGLAPAC